MKFALAAFAALMSIFAVHARDENSEPCNLYFLFFSDPDCKNQANVDWLYDSFVTSWMESSRETEKGCIYNGFFSRKTFCAGSTIT